MLVQTDPDTFWVHQRFDVPATMAWLDRLDGATLRESWSSRGPHMRDRVEAAGGSLSIRADDGNAIIEIRTSSPVVMSPATDPTPVP